MVDLSETISYSNSSSKMQCNLGATKGRKYLYERRK
jgi:hypothetical protein